MRGLRRRQAGFTLLEMLVALALFSLILSFFGALFYSLNATNAAIGRIERKENVDVVRRYLQRTLEGIRTYSYLDAKGIRGLRFTGEQSRVEFVGLSTGDRESGGLYETEAWLDPDGRLILQRRLLGRQRETELSAEVLLEGLESLTFFYFPCPSGLPSVAVNRWTGDSQLPFLISVTAIFKAGDVREWQEVSAFIPGASCEW